MNDLELFKYKYIDNKADKTLFLLHGTGGNENDFMFLNEQLSKSYNLLGLRGNVDENGMNRFFRRVSFGVFDQQNIKEEGIKLHSFIQFWMKKHNVNIDQLAFLGYSNGANMLLAAMFYYPETIKNSLLLHPMLPFVPSEKINLSKNSIFLSYSENDEMISEEESIKLINMMRSYKAKAQIKTYSTGHQISSKEIEDCIEYLL